MPHEAIDPVPIACEIVLALQSFIARRTTFTDPAILSITQIAGGNTNNVIPEEVELLGTLRTVAEATRSRCSEAFEHIVRLVAEAHGAEGRSLVDTGYPVTTNDNRASTLVRELAKSLFGDDAYENLAAPIMGGEDFAYVLQKIPGAMAFLGVCPPDADPASRAPIHNCHMNVHEQWLDRGVAMHCAFATRFLARGWA